MTERWRKRLEGIDQVGPGDDVYQRAKNGSTLPEPQSPMQRTSTRVVTVIAAFVVFALAISVFAIPALRLSHDDQFLSAGGQLLPLWPVRAVDEIAALQQQADAGEAPWSLAPDLLARRFGVQVMGWPAGSISVSTLPDPACHVMSGTYPSDSYPASVAADTCGWLAYGSTGTVGPSAGACAPDISIPMGNCISSTPLPGSIVHIVVSPCGSIIGICPSSDLEYLDLFQPGGTGEGMVWAVLSATSPSIELAVSPGQIVANGSSVSTGARIPIGESFGLGVHVGTSVNCDEAIATDLFHSPGSTGDLVMASGSELRANLGPRSATDCQQEEPGYVFVATSKRTIVSGGVAIDPLQGASGTGLELTSFAAVPITFEWSDPTAATPSLSPTVATITPSPTETSGGDWKTHTSGLGFTIDVPSDWGITDVTDELIVSAPGGDPYVQIDRVPKDPLRDDSSFPLDYAAMANDPQAHFRGDGQAFIIQWLTGDGSAPTPEQAAEFDRITSSIAFPATTFGAMQGGWTAVGPILQSASAEWVIYKLTGDHYIAALTGGGARTAFGPAPTCSGGSGSYEVRETGVAGISCSDGTGGDWDFTTGEPKSGNLAGFDVPLSAWPAVRSWDGWLLVELQPIPSPSASPP